MTLYSRYINGETEQVYKDIYALGQDAFLPNKFPDIEMVLTETFQRVAYNLEIIYTELKHINYTFWKNELGSEEALLKPPAETDKLIDTLEQAINPFGYLPLSLKMFYKIVGSCNFVWDYRQDKAIMWEMADAIQIAPLTYCVSEVTDKYWLQQAKEYMEDEDFGFTFLVLAADDLHKDNVSGGPPYSLEITKQPSIDGNFINEPNNTTFINYLRICFEYCGFPGIRSEAKNDNQLFFDRVNAQLKPI